MTCALLAMAAPSARAQTNGDLPPARVAPVTPDAPVAQTSPSLDFAWLRAGLPLQLGVSLAAYSWAGPAFGWMGVTASSAPSMAPRSASRSDRWRKRF
jgi:hypothetical protein